MREWLKSARKRSGMTITEMAGELGISRSYYAYIESGKRKKRLDTTFCVKLAKIFCLPVQQIVEFEEGRDAGPDPCHLERSAAGTQSKDPDVKIPRQARDDVKIPRQARDDIQPARTKEGGEMP